MSKCKRCGYQKMGGPTHLCPDGRFEEDANMQSMGKLETPWEHGPDLSDDDMIWRDEVKPDIAELLKSIHSLLAVIELIEPLIRHTCTCPRSSCMRKILSQAEYEMGCSCGAAKARAKALEILREGK